MEQKSPNTNEPKGIFDQHIHLAKALEEAAKAGAKAEHDATHDSLVKDALNRRGLEKYLESAVSPQAILVVDATNFKAVNDYHGYESGNKLIVDTYNMLRESVRPNDVIARLGGDEFVIVLAHVGNGSELNGDKTPRSLKPIDHIDDVKARVAKVVEKYLDERPALRTSPINFDLAVGGVEWSGSTEISELMAQAEADMKAHKDRQHQRGQHRPAYSL